MCVITHVCRWSKWLGYTDAHATCTSTTTQQHMHTCMMCICNAQAQRHHWHYCSNTLAHVHMHTCTQTQLQQYISTCAHVHMHTCTCTCMHICVHTMSTDASAIFVFYKCWCQYTNAMHLQSFVHLWTTREWHHICGKQQTALPNCNVLIKK